MRTRVGAKKKHKARKVRELPESILAPPGEKEVWKAVKGHEAYEVSNWGRMRHGSHVLSTRPSLCKDYYPAIKLNGSKRYLVHVLVAQAFLGDKPEGKQVNHIDGIKQNNFYKNLEYVTQAENATHAYRIGLMSGHWKLSEAERSEIVKLHQSGDYLTRDLVKKFNTTLDCVSLIVRRAGFKLRREQKIPLATRLKIKEEWIPYKVPMRVLAKKYGVSERSIELIIGEGK